MTQCGGCEMAKIWMLIEDGEADKAGTTIVKISGDFDNNLQLLQSGDMTNAQMLAASMCVPVQQEQAACAEMYGVEGSDYVEFYSSNAALMDVATPMVKFEQWSQDNHQLHVSPIQNIDKDAQYFRELFWRICVGDRETIKTILSDWHFELTGNELYEDNLRDYQAEFVAAFGGE